MASLSNREIEEQNAGTQIESPSEVSNVESSDEFGNYPGRSQKLDAKFAWHLITFVCQGRLFAMQRCGTHEETRWDTSLNSQLHFIEACHLFTSIDVESCKSNC